MYRFDIPPPPANLPKRNTAHAKLAAMPVGACCEFAPSELGARNSVRTAVGVLNRNPALEYRAQFDPVAQLLRVWRIR
jgi:hypothetical protein